MRVTNRKSLMTRLNLTIISPNIKHMKRSFTNGMNISVLCRQCIFNIPRTNIQRELTALRRSITYLIPLKTLRRSLIMTRLRTLRRLTLTMSTIFITMRLTINGLTMNNSSRLPTNINSIITLNTSTLTT